MSKGQEGHNPPHGGISSGISSTLHSSGHSLVEGCNRNHQLQPTTIHTNDRHREMWLRRKCYNWERHTIKSLAACPDARKQVEKVIAKLELLNDERDIVRGIDGTTGFVLMEGNWRIVWCTTSNVLIIGANPLLIIGVIYQIYKPPKTFSRTTW